MVDMWPPGIRSKHKQELRKVHIAIKFLLLLRCCIVGQFTQCCNVGYINHQDGIRLNVSLHLGENLLRWVHPQLTSLRVTHLPGLYNNALYTIQKSSVCTQK